MFDRAHESKHLAKIRSPKGQCGLGPDFQSAAVNTQLTVRWLWFHVKEPKSGISETKCFWIISDIPEVKAFSHHEQIS